MPGRPARPRLTARRMRHADLDEVMEIERAAFKHPWSRELLRRELDHDWSTILLALEAPGDAPRGAVAEGTRGGPFQAERIVGFLIYWLVHDEVHVLNVAVSPELRRRGIGRFLLQECEKAAHDAKAALLTLEVRRSNTGAIELYKSFEYKQVGVRPNYYVDEGEDAIVMVKELRPRTW